MPPEAISVTYRISIPIRINPFPMPSNSPARLRSSVRLAAPAPKPSPAHGGQYIAPSQEVGGERAGLRNGLSEETGDTIAGTGKIQPQPDALEVEPSPRELFAVAEMAGVQDIVKMV